MKKPDKQILAMLQAFDQKEVLKAFELYQAGISDGFKKTRQQLKEDGWSPQKEKPEGREFYFFEGEYWVQSQEMRDKQIKEQIEAMKKKKASGQYTGQKMDLELSEIKCPMCDSGMYKQSICTGCAEGRKGYKIRLICEENPDHEVLL